MFTFNKHFNLFSFIELDYYHFHLNIISTFFNLPISYIHIINFLSLSKFNPKAVFILPSTFSSIHLPIICIRFLSLAFFTLIFLSLLIDYFHLFYNYYLDTQ